MSRHPHHRVPDPRAGGRLRVAVNIRSATAPTHPDDEPGQRPQIAALPTAHPDWRPASRTAYVTGVHPADSGRRAGGRA